MEKENITAEDPRVVEMSFTVFEKILTSINYETKKELEKLANIMLEKVQDEKYPETLRLAYKEAVRKINILTLEQLNEIKKIIVAD